MAVTESEIDDSLSDGLMSGTFRWGRNKKFYNMPKFPTAGVEIGKGWGQYLRTRDADGDMVQFAQKDSSLLDCLTFPATIAFWLQKLNILHCGGGGCGGGGGCDRHGPGGLNVVVLGATAKCEERVLRDTKAFHELGCMFPCTRIKLWLVGPEMSAQGVVDDEGVQAFAKLMDLPGNLEVRMIRIEPPCATKFLSQYSEMNTSNTVLVTFNGGFGNFVDSGSTTQDSGITAIFTSANDYADVRGETIVHTRLVGSHYVQPPVENPYHAGSTFQGEGGSERAWFCCNHSAYAIRGVDAGRRKKVDAKMNKEQKHKLLDDVLKEVLKKDVNEMVASAGTAIAPAAGVAPGGDEATEQKGALDKDNKKSKDNKDKKGKKGKTASTNGGEISDKTLREWHKAFTHKTREKEALLEKQKELETREKELREQEAFQQPDLITRKMEELLEKQREVEARATALKGMEKLELQHRDLATTVFLGQGPGEVTKASGPSCVIVEAEEGGKRGYRLRVALPLIDSLAGANLEVSTDKLQLTCATADYNIQAEWPQSVDADSCKAKFSKKTRELSVFAPLQGGA